MAGRGERSRWARPLQTKTVTTAIGNTVKFKILIQNDGTDSDTYKILGTKTSKGYKISYFDGTTNVTSQVTGGTFKVTLAPAGTSRSINFMYGDGRRKNFYDGKSHLQLQPDRAGDAILHVADPVLLRMLRRLPHHVRLVVTASCAATSSAR